MSGILYKNASKPDLIPIFLSTFRLLPYIILPNPKLEVRVNFLESTF